jgi:hypothetical protein
MAQSYQELINSNYIVDFVAGDEKSTQRDDVAK